MTLAEFGDWLYQTPTSTAIRETSWIIPASQSVHIVAVAVVVGAAIVSDLRLAGVLATEESPRTVVRRYLPWMWWALAVLLITGTIQSVGEPNRVLTNQTFGIKMALVLFAFILTLLFRYPIMHPSFELQHARWQALVKPMAWVSLAVWIVVIFCGRWIAYTI